MNYSFIYSRYYVLSEVSKFQSFKITRFQGFKVPKSQSSKVSKFQDSKISRWRNFQHCKFPSSKFEKMQQRYNYLAEACHDHFVFSYCRASSSPKTCFLFMESFLPQTRNSIRFACQGALRCNGMGWAAFPRLSIRTKMRNTKALIRQHSAFNGINRLCMNTLSVN